MGERQGDFLTGGQDGQDLQEGENVGIETLRFFLSRSHKDTEKERGIFDRMTGFSGLTGEAEGVLGLKT